jgi:HK97 family phage major capsid protein
MKKQQSQKNKEPLSFAQLQVLHGEELSTKIIDRATPSHALLDEIDRIDVESTEHRELVVTSRIKAALTGEHGSIDSNVSLTEGHRYTSVKSLFGKVYAQTLITDEIVSDSHIEIAEEFIRLASEDFLNMFVEQLLYGDESKANGIQRLRGVLEARIDKASDFSEALKEDDERHQDFYKVVKTGTNGSFGANAAAVKAHFSAVKKSLPSKYKRNAKWYMNADTFEELEQVADSTGQSLLIRWGRPVYGGEETFLMLGHPIAIIDQMNPSEANGTPVMFGDLRSAIKVLDLKGEGSYFTTDKVTVKGATIAYIDSRYGEIMQANDALRVSLQAA